jgi:hypothetical protein
MIALIGAALLAAAALTGTVMSDVEQPSYTVVKTDGAIEIRDYAPMIVAEVDVSGPREESISTGFRMIADFIFGNNVSAQKLAMTAPVIQQSSEKIAMTAPVIQQGEANSWKVRFVMPASYTLETLPKPNNKQVKISTQPEKRFAVIRFAGSTQNENVAEHEALLRAYLAEHKLRAIAPATYAFYNPPWTLPPLRRNEVMIEVKR